MDGSDFHKLCQYWREQISRYQVWTTGTDYRGIMILNKKKSGCYFENELQINNDAVLVDFVFPGGITVNSACVYGPSHKDDLLGISQVTT